MLRDRPMSFSSNKCRGYVSAEFGVWGVDGMQKRCGSYWVSPRREKETGVMGIGDGIREGC